MKQFVQQQQQLQKKCVNKTHSYGEAVCINTNATI